MKAASDIFRFTESSKQPGVLIRGAGPAGSSAALAALEAGAQVHILERSRFPRHKVCGEFLSPEIVPLLAELGVWDRMLDARPARIRRMVLHFGAGPRGTRREAPLSEPAWGLSRWEFDKILLEHAMSRGAQLEIAEAPLVSSNGFAEILATGRQVKETKRGNRLFGFKAHFAGPPQDAVELFFFGECYVGLNSVESNFTNICGLASEGFLRRFAFNYDAVVEQCLELRQRVNPLSRSFPWISTGPLEFRQRFGEGQRAGAHAYGSDGSGASSVAGSGPASYPAGDALSFIDPFTGSGLLAAVKTGMLAGRAAAQGDAVESYLATCRESLRQPYRVASVLRKLAMSGVAEKLAPWIPAQFLFALTRPR